MNYIAGIGDIVIASCTEDKIITHALGSCVAVTFHCPKTKVSGMIHIALPNRLETKSFEFKRGYFADEGLNCLIDILKNEFRFNFGTAQIKIFGGAIPNRMDDVFKIGPRNLQAVYDVLDKRNLTYQNLEVGGTVSRTIELNVDTGDITIKRQPLII